MVDMAEFLELAIFFENSLLTADIWRTRQTPADMFEADKTLKCPQRTRQKFLADMADTDGGHMSAMGVRMSSLLRRHGGRPRRTSVRQQISRNCDVQNVF